MDGIGVEFLISLGLRLEVIFRYVLGLLIIGDIVLHALIKWEALSYRVQCPIHVNNLMLKGFRRGPSI